MHPNKQHLLELEKRKVKQILDFIKINEIKRNTSQYRQFKKMISDLFILDISLYDDYLNDNLELSFDVLNDNNTLGNYKEVFSNKLKETFKIITLNEGNIAFDELSSPNQELRVYACSEIIRIMFHEISHYNKMKLLVSSQSNDKTLKLAKEKILIDSIIKREMYIKNHDSFLNENDALIDSNNKMNRLLETRKENLDYVSAYLFSTLDVIDNNTNKRKEVSREDYVNYFVDALLYKYKNNTLYLEKYPILKKEYNSNGIKKSLSELIENYYKELDEVNNSNIDYNEKYEKNRTIKRMYFDIISRRVIPLRREHEISDIELEKLSKDDRVQTLFEEIKIDLLRLKKINLAFLDKIHIKKKIYDSNLNYISKNNDTVRFYIGNTSYIYEVDDFIKLFDLDLIYNNDNLDENEKEKSINFIRNYFFKRLPKNGYFIFKNGNRVTILDFYNNYIIPNIKELYDIDLNQYIKYLKRIVISENECENIINQELVHSFYTKKVDAINSFKKRLDDIKEREIEL